VVHPGHLDDVLDVIDDVMHAARRERMIALPGPEGLFEVFGPGVLLFQIAIGLNHVSAGARALRDHEAGVEN